MTSLNTSDRISEVMSDYYSFINKVDIGKLPYVTKERINRNFQKYGEAMNTLMVYPDIFADIMTPRNSAFSMFFEQRMVLRAMARYRQSFFTFTRGFSKSFLAFYDKYTTCMFIPRHKAFIVAGTKAQAALIAREKVIDDLWVKFPLLANEMRKFKVANKTKTPYKSSGDNVEFDFSNGSVFDVIGGQMRGGRRHSGIFEEVITLDPIYINETVIPLLNTTRSNIRGEINPHEPQGKKTFITSAGWQGTFSHDKLVETLCLSLLDPDKYFVMGGSYEVLVMHGRLAEDTIRELISSPSYSPDSFDREYRSIWSPVVSGAVFQPNSITELRKIKRAELKAREGIGNDFYVVAADLAYDGKADTAVIIMRVTPGEYRFAYRFINMFTIDVANFETISNILKQTCMKYNAKLLVYDANGVGATLREHLNKESIVGTTTLPAYGIINPPTNVADQLRKVKDKDCNICYEIKSGGQKGSEIHGVFLGKMTNGSIRLLVKSAVALQNFSKNKNFGLASSAIKDRFMKPYYYTDLFETELKNLDFKRDLANENMIKVVKRNDNIEKDFFSAAEYGVYAVTQHMELPFYKSKRKNKPKKYTFTSSDQKAVSSYNNRRSGRSIDSRRRRR